MKTMVDLLKLVEGETTASSGLVEFAPGDTVRISLRVKEGDRERIQVLEGVIIARHNKTGPTQTFTMRRISHGVGIEWICHFAHLILRK